MQGSFKDPLYNKDAMGGQAEHGRGRAKGEGGRTTNEQTGRESMKIQEPVEAPEQIEKEGRLFLKTTAETGRRAATDDRSSE
ncbi:hypothetical protein MTO96_049883 [Rhipicephalus appendiculatus]